MPYEGSIELIGGLKQKNNGDFPLIHSKDVYQPVETTLPEDGILQVGVMYFLGTPSEITVGFPESANAGDMIYMSFSVGDTIPTINIKTNNFVGIDKQISTNKYYETIGMYNGSLWVFVINEVTI